MKNILTEKEYPKELVDWKHKTSTLWFLGDTHLLEKPKVSVIGTREISKEGVSRTRKITKILTDGGFVVVSGMAKGVDTVAHCTALENNGHTIAVMGTPIDQCYPKENQGLKETIALRGLVLSQFKPGSTVHKSNFPHRNELMAALSDLTLVIEAGEKSGTRYQVEFAIKMKRKVGFLASQANKGISWVDKALESGFGFVVTEPDDLIKNLNGNFKREPVIIAQKEFDLFPVERIIKIAPVFDETAPSKRKGSWKKALTNFIKLITFRPRKHD